MINVDVAHPGKVSGALGSVRSARQLAHQPCDALASEQVRGISVGFSAITTGPPGTTPTVNAAAVTIAADSAEIAAGLLVTIVRMPIHVVFLSCRAV
ncbi:hypothetical protein [Streptosporangium sandarakinum]